jgi:PAS domain S-box-containing protein
VAISPHRSLQAQLDEASALLDVVFARAPVGLAFFDDQLRYVRVNDRMAAMNGLPASAHLGRRVREVLPGLPRDVEDDLRRVLETGQPLVEVEVSGVAAGRRAKREWLSSYWPVRPAGGDMVTGIGAVIFDVTERRTARRAIRAQADRYEALLLALSEAGEGMVVVEEDGHCVYANAAFEQISGYTFPELAAMDSLLDLTLPPELDLSDPSCGPLAHMSLLQLRRRDGRILEVEAAGVPLESERDRQLVVLVRDVTTRRMVDVERERVLARAELLAEAAARLDAAGDEAAMAAELARLCVRDVADTCVVILGGPGAVHRTAAAARVPELESAVQELHLRYPLDEAPHRSVAEALRTGTTVLVDDIGRERLAAIATDARHLALLEAPRLESAAIVPLRARGRVCGAMAVGLTASTAPTRGDLVPALEQLGRIAGLALEAARLSDERRATARTLQSALLPPALPAIAGLELAGRHRSADDGEVGGDFYDVFATGDGEWAAVIGDVCGRGADAVAITTLARCTLRASTAGDRRPAAMLRELNDAVLAHGGDFGFCTALYVALRPGDGGTEARVAGGGNLLPLLVRAGGDVEPIGRTGTLLGVVRDPEVGETAVRLEPGDALVLATDGAAGPDDGLAALLRENAGRSAAEIARAVEEGAVAAGGGRLRDDAAVVVLRAV